jgi:hypothetical protein
MMILFKKPSPQRRMLPWDLLARGHVIDEYLHCVLVFHIRMLYPGLAWHYGSIKLLLLLKLPELARVLSRGLRCLRDNFFHILMGPGQLLGASLASTVLCIVIQHNLSFFGHLDILEWLLAGVQGCLWLLEEGMAVWRVVASTNHHFKLPLLPTLFLNHNLLNRLLFVKVIFNFKFVLVQGDAGPRYGDLLSRKVQMGRLYSCHLLLVLQCILIEDASLALVRSLKWDFLIDVSREGIYAELVAVFGIIFERWLAPAIGIPRELVLIAPEVLFCCKAVMVYNYCRGLDLIVPLIEVSLLMIVLLGYGSVANYTTTVYPAIRAACNALGWWDALLGRR